MQWTRLTSPQFAEADRDRPVILPTAAIEQHSLHLPVWTDTAIADRLSSELDATCGDRLLVLPTLWLGCSAHHARYPGTLTTGLDTWSANVADIARSVLRHGFRNLVILNCHGGNTAILAVTLEKIRYEFPDAMVAGFSYWAPAGPAMAKVRESDFGGMGHACEMETSIMLAIDPDVVDMDRAEPDGNMRRSRFTRFDMLDGPKVMVSYSFEDITNHGGYGDPTTATAEKGRRFIDAIVGELAAFIADLEAGKL